MLEHLVLITSVLGILSMPMTYLYPAVLCLCSDVIRVPVAYRITVSAGGVAVGVSLCVFGAGLLPLFRGAVVQNLTCLCLPQRRLSPS